MCDQVGLVWMIDRHKGQKVVHHGGTTNGYQADVRLVPERGLAWVMLTNSLPAAVNTYIVNALDNDKQETSR